MAEVIIMPRLSDTMESGKVAKWHKNVGDKVEEGDILAEIETDKAIQDFESEYEGTLLYQGVAEGDSGSMESILAIVGKPGEDISSLIKSGAPAAAAEESKPAPDVSPVTKPVTVPDNIHVILIPRLSDTMEEGKVAKWHKNVGDQVAEGDILAEIETDKAVQDFESEYEGTLLYQGIKENESKPMESVLAIIGPAGADVSAFTSGKVATAAPATQESVEEKPVATIAKTKAPAAATVNGRIAISPLAKKMAQDKGIDLSTIHGSGEGGRIVKRDIENYKAVAQAAPSVAQPAAFVQPTIAFVPGEDTETPNSQVRNIIAKRLAESKFTAPHYYLIVEIDMEKSMAARKEINDLPDVKISFNDMVIKASAMALRKHPMVNSSWAGEKIIHHGNINIGVAVAVPDGLVVPVIKNTDYLNYTAISAAVKDLAGRARNRTVKANEMEGSTFTVSNLGMYGIQMFTSIINQPNACILSVGGIVEKPVVKNGQIVVGHTMQVSLACDHRVVDGATGAQFLQTLKTYLENPVTMLV